MFRKSSITWYLVFVIGVLTGSCFTGTNSFVLHRCRVAAVATSQQPASTLFRRVNISSVALLQTRATVQRRLVEKSDDTDKKQATRTKIDDGSPLGVAIVVLGSIALTLFGKADPTLPSGDSPAYFAVFIAASVAAGISRWIRNYEKEQ